MPDEQRRIYWDSNVPLSYINGIADRLAVIDELFKQARGREIELLTSSVTRVEVAYAAEEKKSGQLDREVEQQINDLWAPGSPIKTVEFHDLIGDDAKMLMRRGISQGWGSLTPLDAVHLATAKRMEVAEFHTYCERLHRWSSELGFPVGEPETAQGVLDGGMKPPATESSAPDEA